MANNNHGGSRAGAGRKPLAPRSVATDSDGNNQVDAMTFLLNCVNDSGLDAGLRIRAAGLLVASGRKSKVKEREQAKAEKLSDQSTKDWKTRILEELSDETAAN